MADQSNLGEFLITTGRTLSQMSLYAPEHPSVKGSIEEAHRRLNALVGTDGELSLSIDEGKLVVNGSLPERVADNALRPFVQLMEFFQLHTITFRPGVRPDELIAFLLLAKSKDRKNDRLDVASFFRDRNVDHIDVNQVKYEKIRDDEKIGRGDGASDGEPQTGADDEEVAFGKELERLDLDSFLRRLVERSVSSQAEREKLLGRVTEMIRLEIEKTVERQTKALQQEKVRATNERERTESVVEAMAEGVVVVDESGNVLMMNSVAENIYGVQLGQCVGRPLWEGVKKEQMAALAKDLAMPPDQPFVKEVELRADEATQKTLRASTATVQDPNGRVVGMISVLSDVTKQKELNRLQNEFMANVTHDLRAPIHALKLAIGAILEGSAGPVNDEQERMLSLANRNSDRLSRLIDDLLDFSALESGKLKIQPQVIEIEPLLRDARNSFDAWSKSRDVDLVLKAEKRLFPIYADGDRILQVVNNLLSNAIKFTPAGGRVILRASNRDDLGRRRVRIEVEDSGKGISKEDQERVFQRFVQLKNEERQDIRGTGLGLSICQALIEQHQGTLKIESPPPDQKSGSRFWFDLPAVGRSDRGETAPPPAPEPAAKPPAKAPATFWKRIWSKIRVPLLLLLILPSFASARPYWGRVRRVLDADRIQLQDGTVVRYLGIDAPDVGSRYHTEAVAANRSWVGGKQVRLEYGLQERDASGAWQAYVFTDGVLINLEMVRSGLALVARLSNEESYLPRLLRAEREAHGEKRGMWRDTVIDPYPVRMQKMREERGR